MATKIVQITAAAIAISAILLTGWIFYLFGEEDYYPEPGTLAFYLKLSSTIRSLPLSDAISRPVYHGSIGDGPKPPQSSVCYAAQSSKETWIVSNIRTYLQKDGYALDPSDTGSNIASLSEQKPLHYMAYTNRAGHSVHLVINNSRKPLEVDVCLTHYE
ncbi:hypothetical protein RY831_05240 [Noviherbaspirillum sp. CPCC 100848]|uniref:Uncharacterized protein n=1 Tax=Noviherbaspirillum album TaxID=3080276 RepID=A0ABU6J4I5_9BURK|nr:hypothetical protein [Noviherbaspirillum sp. CPCC 100848]MEC4718541.1 hypothetical protein [Noviherbaspirillum sp. CPCC 100848]